MHPTFQVLERNLDTLTGSGELLLLNPPSSVVPEELANYDLRTCDFRVAQQLSARVSSEVSFGLEASSKVYDRVVVFMPKSKGELDLLLAYAASLLKEGQTIFVVGEKKSGIASAAKKLSALGRAFKLDSAKHCQLWRADLAAPGEAFNLEQWFSHYEVKFADETLVLTSMPGVFSFERLDEGTQMLLESLAQRSPKRLEGRTLDFGCGSGVIGVCAKKMYPDVELEMVDINWLALECTRRSLAKNGQSAQVYASDGWSEVSGRVNAVVSNPPFHSGINTEYETSETFIRDACQKMNKHAPLLLVANRFLKYPGLIEATFGRCDTVNQSGKFNVYLTFR